MGGSKTVSMQSETTNHEFPLPLSRPTWVRNDAKPQLWLNAYAGIGSRETPQDVLKLMRELGVWYARHGKVLRSGGATGADMAFEKGCDRENPTLKTIWTADEEIPKWAFREAREFHPAWDRLGEYGRRLHARNTLIVLDKETAKPAVDFVLFWTKKNSKGEWRGGTSQALRIAEAYGIPAYDVGRYQNLFWEHAMEFIYM